MKNAILGIIITVFTWQIGVSQKLAYFESSIILDNMPAFIQANNELDTIAKQWDAEIDNQFKQVDQMYKNYVKNESALSPEQKQKKQQEIFNAEKQAKSLKDQKFGMEGEMSELQEQKIKPLHDKVFNAAKEVAKEMKYDYVFDLSMENTWVYLNEDYDITNLIKLKLGL